MNTGKYKMSINQVKKEMNVLIEGNFTPVQAEQFVKEYNRHVSSIQPSDFVLRLDCQDLNVVTAELVPSLEACYTLYKSSNFKKTIFEIKNNTIVKMQLNRIARKVGLACEISELA